MQLFFSQTDKPNLKFSEEFIPLLPKLVKGDTNKRKLYSFQLHRLSLLLLAFIDNVVYITEKQIKYHHDHIFASVCFFP